MRVNKKGRLFEALVLRKRRGELKIAPIQRGITYNDRLRPRGDLPPAKRGRPRTPRE